MLDQYGRTISYLRVSVTDRCNLNCRYCGPIRNLKQLSPKDILSFEEICEVVETAVELGVDKVRLTGGEPLVRKGIVTLTRALAQVKGVHDLAMTTNGTLLAQFASDLANAGLDRVNISLDTMDSHRYKQLTRGGDLQQVLDGIEAAKKQGLHPIKLNCVVGEYLDETDYLSVQEFAYREGLSVRKISLMDFESGRFSVVEGGSGGDCSNCNRLRLSSDGRVRPCLFSDVSFSVREQGIKLALINAIRHKPQTGSACKHDWMRGIGG